MPSDVEAPIYNPGSPPPVRKSLKRSASVASLPTPPRTRRDRERRQSSRSSAYSSDDHSSEEEQSEAEPDARQKRRKLEIDDEESFWMGGEAATESVGIKDAASRAGSNVDADSDAEETESRRSYSPKETFRSPSPGLAPHLLRKSQALASGASFLASPPPSRRSAPGKKSVTVEDAKEMPSKEKGKGKESKTKEGAELSESSPPPPSLALPLTPQMTRKRLEKKGLVLARDSPDNPFLDHGEGDDRPEQLPPAKEKPTMTYVFRGKKAEFVNPFYSPSTQTSERSKGKAPHELPIDHPDYSPDMKCPPKRLFAKPRRIASLPKRSAAAALLDEHEEEPEESTEVGLNIARRLFEAPRSKGKKDNGPISR